MTAPAPDRSRCKHFSSAFRHSALALWPFGALLQQHGEVVAPHAPGVDGIRDKKGRRWVNGLTGFHIDAAGGIKKRTTKTGATVEHTIHDYPELAAILAPILERDRWAPLVVNEHTGQPTAPRSTGTTGGGSPAWPASPTRSATWMRAPAPSPRPTRTRRPPRRPWRSPGTLKPRPADATSAGSRSNRAGWPSGASKAGENDCETTVYQLTYTQMLQPVGALKTRSAGIVGSEHSAADRRTICHHSPFQHPPPFEIEASANDCRHMPDQRSKKRA
jgi:hypothetical protein